MNYSVIESMCFYIVYYIVPVHIVESGIILDRNVSIQYTLQQYNFVSYSYTKATGLLPTSGTGTAYSFGAHVFTPGF